jgi:hypothetical protein
MLLWAVWLACSAGHAQDAVGALTVDAADVQGEISPYVFGANYGPWALVSIDMQQAAADSGVTHLRFPGGNWGDDNSLQPQQFDLFMLQARNWGMDVSVSVNLENGTPEQAAAWVRYANLEQGWNIRHWSIGNEPDLYPDYDIDTFNAEWRASALAMREVDPTILLIGPEVSQFPDTVAGSEYLNVRREWVRAFLTANGDLVDMVSIHRYPFPIAPNMPPTTIDDLRQNAPRWDVMIDNLRADIRETVGTDKPIAVTEASSHWSQPIGGEATADSPFHAIWWADVLGRLIRQRVEIVNYFAFSTFGANAGYGLLDRYHPRPTYYTYQLYQHFGDLLVASTSTEPDVSITSALTSEGDTLTLMIVNLSDDAKSVPLIVSGVFFNGAAQLYVLDAEHLAELAAPHTVTNGSAVDLPPRSVTLLRIPILPS